MKAYNAHLAERKLSGREEGVGLITSGAPVEPYPVENFVLLSVNFSFFVWQLLGRIGGARCIVFVDVVRILFRVIYVGRSKRTILGGYVYHV